MNKAELIKQLRKAHEKQLFDDEAVGRVLDGYAQQEKQKAVELLKVAECPNCDGDGVINLGDDLEQCQWCDERDWWLKQQEE